MHHAADRDAAAVQGNREPDLELRCFTGSVSSVLHRQLDHALRHGEVLPQLDWLDHGHRADAAVLRFLLLLRGEVSVCAAGNGIASGSERR